MIEKTVQLKYLSNRFICNMNGFFNPLITVTSSSIVVETLQLTTKSNYYDCNVTLIQKKLSSTLFFNISRDLYIPDMKKASANIFLRSYSVPKGYRSQSLTWDILRNAAYVCVLVLAATLQTTVFCLITSSHISGPYQLHSVMNFSFPIFLFI